MIELLKLSLQFLCVILLPFLVAAVYMAFIAGIVYLLYLGYTVSGWYAVLAVAIIGIVKSIELYNP